jgi:hypothetical protein
MFPHPDVRPAHFKAESIGGQAIYNLTARTA